MSQPDIGFAPAGNAAAVATGVVMLEFLQDLGENAKQWVALRLRFSHLAEPPKRDKRAAVLRVLDGLVRNQGARQFGLLDGDLLLFIRRRHADALRSALVGLLVLFGDDQNLVGKSDQEERMAVWYELPDDLPTLLTEADRLTRGTQERRANALVSGLGTGLPGGAPTIAVGGLMGADAALFQPSGRRLDAEVLARIETILDRADLGSYLRRQTVCSIVDILPPSPVFDEVFVSLADLRDTVMPDLDVGSNPWLLQQFTMTLDRRVLWLLSRRPDRSLEKGFSININVATILSDEFLRFDDVIAPALHGTVVVEIRVEDVFADPGAFLFARDFVRQRGYRVCIDGLTPETLRYVDRDKLGVDLLKLIWSPELPAFMESAEGEALARDLRTKESGRVILTRCDSNEAVAKGQALNITMFQGRRVEAMIGTARKRTLFGKGLE